jgi:hypothetical protein
MITDRDSKIYSAYLTAYVTARSKSPLSEWLINDEELLAARAMGACDGVDEQMLPHDKWAVLEMVHGMINDKRPERVETPCKVMPMDDAS